MAFTPAPIDLTAAVSGKSYPISGTPAVPAAAPSPAYSNIFIPAIWSGRLIEKFYESSVLPAISNTNYENEISSFGDKVIIRSRPSLNIKKYDAYGKLAYEAPSSNSITLSIDQGKYFAATMDDVMDVQSDVNLMSMWAEDASEQMKISIDRDVLASLPGDLSGRKSLYAAPDEKWTSDKVMAKGTTNATEDGIVIGGDGSATSQAFVSSKAIGTGTGATAANAMSIVDYIINLGQVMDLNLAPESDRKLVLPTKMIALIKKSELRDASLSGDSTSLLRNGRIGMIDRFEIYSSNLLPIGANAVTASAIVACTPQALTFASQLTKMETLRAQETFGNLMRGLQVYGHKIIQPSLMTIGYATAV